MIQLQEPYQPRPIRFLELWQTGEWRLKVYGIAYRRSSPRSELVQAAKQVAQTRLQTTTAPHYHTGFLGIHDGRGANFVFVDFWAEENELHHHVYVSPTDQPTQLEYATPTGLTACVWDLRVICFERQAWIDAVLANPDGPDLDKYCSMRLNEDV